MHTFYWYPKCSTCKKAMKWLDDNNVSYETIDMVQTPPSAETIANWMENTDLSIRQFFNTSGIKYREQGLKDLVNEFSVEEASNRLSQDGMLIKRPILVENNQLIFGFKESDYEAILNN